MEPAGEAAEALHSRGMIGLWAAGVALVLLAPLAGYLLRPDGCTPARGWAVGKPAPPGEPGLLLPDATGLVPPGQYGPLSRVALRGGNTPARYETVEIGADGGVRLVGQGPRVTRTWRGIGLPLEDDSAASPDDIVLRVQTVGPPSPMCEYAICMWKTCRPDELQTRLGLLGQVGAVPVVLKVRPAATSWPGLAAVLAVDRSGLPLRLAEPPAGEPPRPIAGLEALRWRLRQLAAACPGAEATASDLAVLIRADVRAPWRSLGEVLRACRDAGTWRVSFAAFVGGREVALGRTGATLRAIPRPWPEPEQLIFKLPLFRARSPEVFVPVSPEPPAEFSFTPAEAFSDIPTARP